MRHRHLQHSPHSRVRPSCSSQRQRTGSRWRLEHWLAVEQQQQLFMAEMVEGWMTEEDAIEVAKASWHERPSHRATCDLASHVGLQTEAEHVFEQAFAAAFEFRGRAEMPRPSSEAEPVATNSH